MFLMNIDYNIILYSHSKFMNPTNVRIEIAEVIFIFFNSPNYREIKQLNDFAKLLVKRDSTNDD